MSNYLVKVMEQGYEVEAGSLEQAAWRGVAQHFAQQRIPAVTLAEVYENGNHVGGFEVAAAWSREYDGNRPDAPIDVYTLTARRIP